MNASCYRRNEKIEEAPLQSELMLFHPETAKFFVLNSTMAFVWRHCNGQTTLDQMLNALVEEFDHVEHPAARADLTEALDELQKLGLIVTEI